MADYALGFYIAAGAAVAVVALGVLYEADKVTKQTLWVIAGVAAAVGGLFWQTLLDVVVRDETIQGASFRCDVIAEGQADEAEARACEEVIDRAIAAIPDALAESCAEAREALPKVGSTSPVVQSRSGRCRVQAWLDNCGPVGTNGCADVHSDARTVTVEYSEAW